MAGAASAGAAAPETGIPMLKEILEQLNPLDDEWIPEQSLVREFIGGSIFTS